MPPKKKGKGKKKKKSKTPEILPVPFDYTHPEDVAEEWVNLNVRLLSWTYLDFTFAFFQLDTNILLHYTL